ncbi:MAG TPA: GNAT family N-acetyltransferase, partial [Gemmataceae bacterium]|nr:GNAT family N-acetyltransferase [Gemmataceae bacterium]
MDFALVRRLDELAARALPAHFVQELDGWRLRHQPLTVIRRANSVWPADHGAMPMAEKLVAVEHFYRSRKLLPSYQISPASRPSNLDAVLQERGYSLETPTLVQVADLSHDRGSSAADLHRVTVLDAPTERWLAANSEVQNLGPSEADARSEILGAIGSKAAYAVVDRAGRPTAVGRAVLEDDWVGIFGMGTHPSQRRKGAATSVLLALRRWGQERGARRAYLQ